MKRKSREQFERQRIYYTVWFPRGMICFILLIVLFLASSCATVSPARQVLVACQGYASTLTVLAARRAAGKMTDNQVTLVDTLRPGLNKICLDGNFTDPVVAYDLVQDAMFKLIQMEVTTQ